MSKSKWQKLSSKYVYKNPWMKVREDKAIRPDGDEGIYSYVEQPDGVVIIPVNKEGKIWLVRAYRYIYDEERWELAAGGIEGEDQSPLDAAKREMEEELDLQASSWEELGSFRPSNGRIEHTTHVFLAKNIKEIESDLEDFDIVDKKLFSLDEINEMIKSGEIVDGYLINAMYFYKLYIQS